MNREHAPKRTRGRSRRHGLSLAEVLVSALLLGVMLVAATNTVGAVFRSRQTNAGLGHAEILARRLMAEILQARYEDPDEPGVPIGDSSNPLGVESGETNTTRADFDDVDDFDGWNREPPLSQDGTPLAGYGLYNRIVQVARVDPDTVQGNPNTETGLKSIRVTVIDPTGEQFVLWALRSRFGAVEQPPAVDSTFVTFLEGTLRSGTSPVAYHSAKNLVNHAEEP